MSDNACVISEQELMASAPAELLQSAVINELFQHSLVSSEISGRDRKEYSPEAASFKGIESRHQKEPHPTAEQMLYSEGNLHLSEGCFPSTSSQHPLTMSLRSLGIFIWKSLLHFYFFFVATFLLSVRCKNKLHANRAPANHCTVQGAHSRADPSLKETHTLSKNTCLKLCILSPSCREMLLWQRFFDFTGGEGRKR